MQNQMNKYRRLKNLFLRQSYLDAWEDYQRSILKKSFPKWDYIVLTASNEEQGKAFQKQIEYEGVAGVGKNTPRVWSWKMGRTSALQFRSGRRTCPEDGRRIKQCTIKHGRSV